MKIVSKFKDYYDGGASYGVDTTRQYVRQTSVITLQDDKWLYNLEKIIPWKWGISRFVYPKLDVIGFCGKIYPIKDFITPWEREHYTHEWVVKKSKEFVLYDEDIWTYTVDDHSDMKLITFAEYESSLKIKKYHSNEPNELKKEVEILKKHEFLQKVFYHYRVPIFCISWHNHFSGVRLILNPNLKEYAFYKIKDTHAAFQEIDIFVSNNLVSDTKVQVPTGDDNVIRDSKGFNKWTFRKEKF